MKISINNFKAIKALENYEIKPLTILSGVNSSGKSSFIQLLLLFKQTLDLASSRHQLALNGDLYNVNEFRDIITGKNLDNKLKVVLEFTKEEDLAFNIDKRIAIFDSFETYSIKINIDFDYSNEEIFITNFGILYTLPVGEKREQFVTFNTIKSNPDKFTIEANSLLFGEELWGMSPNITDLKYLSIFPSSYEITEITFADSTKKNEKIRQEDILKFSPKIEGIKEMIERKFASMSYIGPVREAPKDQYQSTSPKKTVGKMGEFTAQVLENLATENINFLQPQFDGDVVTHKNIKITLLEGVKFWMCDVFKIGIDIYSKKLGDFYSIFLVNDSNVETTIKHVGFGISQILPVIVEGLIMAENGTLILEQPEIHLHPKIQSLLLDFLYTLILQGKNVIIETHSDHFITRLRRRISENQDHTLLDATNLTFIESGKGEIYFEIMELDDMGTLDYFPEDFIEQSSSELKAIIKAQMTKRTTT